MSNSSSALFAARNYWKRAEVYTTAPLNLHDVTKTIVVSPYRYDVYDE